MVPKKHWMQRLTEEMDLPGETMPGVPVVELAGEQRVLIERHNGVVQYSKERICVKVRYGLIRVCGCGLELNQMTREQLVITGKINSIELQRRDR